MEKTINVHMVFDLPDSFSFSDMSFASKNPDDENFTIYGDNLKSLTLEEANQLVEGGHVRKIDLDIPILGEYSRENLRLNWVGEKFVSSLNALQIELTEKYPHATRLISNFKNTIANFESKFLYKYAYCWASNGKDIAELGRDLLYTLTVMAFRLELNKESIIKLMSNINPKSGFTTMVIIHCSKNKNKAIEILNILDNRKINIEEYLQFNSFMKEALFLL